MNLKSRIENILKHNVFVQTVYRVVLSGFFKFVGLFVRTDDKLVLMNGHGYKYNDSPRAIYNKMLENGLLDEYRVVWALKDVNSAEIPRAEIVKMDSWKYFITALRAKYWVSCVNIERSLNFKKKKTVYMNTWHGAIINLCGNAVKGRKDFHFKQIDYFCINSEIEGEYFERDFGLRHSALFYSGYPRNDELYAPKKDYKEEMLENYGIDRNKKIILYAPTWRDNFNGAASSTLVPPIDWKKWKEKLGKDYVIFLRTHPYTTKLMNVEFDDFVYNLTEYPEVNHLLMAADILISDYSSINLDYAILEKPIICFGYDYDEYLSYRGFYYDLETTMPGGVVRTENGVLDRILNMDYTAEAEQTRKYKNTYMKYGGNAAQKCVDALFGDKKK